MKMKFFCEMWLHVKFIELDIVIVKLQIFVQINITTRTIEDFFLLLYKYNKKHSGRVFYICWDMYNFAC